MYHCRRCPAVLEDDISVCWSCDEPVLADASSRARSLQRAETWRRVLAAANRRLAHGNAEKQFDVWGWLVLSGVCIAGTVLQVRYGFAAGAAAWVLGNALFLLASYWLRRRSGAPHAASRRLGRGNDPVS